MLTGQDGYYSSHQSRSRAEKTRTRDGFPVRSSVHGFDSSSTPKHGELERNAEAEPEPKRDKEQKSGKDISLPSFARAPKGIGTLFEKGDEMIRELSSEEYTNVLREWAPLAAFAANEAKELEIKAAAGEITTVLRGMAVGHVVYWYMFV